MTLELQWRRRWRPSLQVVPWKPLAQLSFDGDAAGTAALKFYVKSKFDLKGYEILFTDLKNFWYEKISDGALQERLMRLNPSIEAPLTKLVDQIQLNLDQPDKATTRTLTLSQGKQVLGINSLLGGLPFCYQFEFEPAGQDVGRDQLVIPLMAMVGELYRQQQELFRTLAAKDKEIDDYRSQGAKVSRKFLETAPFDQITFHNSMVTSKGFENEVKTFGENAFTSLGQDLYREIGTKRAWLLSSPIKDQDMEHVESISGAQGAPSAESWSNRLPTSLLQKNTSPSKTSSNNSSPAKSPSSLKGSSTEATPVKDTELLRRQALERKLEQEEAKKQEKERKKKKLKF